MSIAEKICKPISQIWTTDGVHVVQIKIYDPQEVRKVEQQRNDLLDELIESAVLDERRGFTGFKLANKIRVICKIAKMPWDEIKEMDNA